jgi:hypothetical protein
MSVAIQKQKLLEGVRTKPFSAVATNCRSLWLEVNKAGSAELRQPALVQMSSVARPMLIDDFFPAEILVHILGCFLGFHNP